MSLQVSRLKELVEYNPVSGEFLRKYSKFNPRLHGQRCGYINKEGYRVIKIDGKGYLSGRLAFLYMEGRFPEEIDHLNRIRDDDRWSNLREVDRKQNAANRTGSYHGVHAIKNKNRPTRYYARIRSGALTEYFGPYSSKEEAHETYINIKKQRGLLQC